MVKRTVIGLMTGIAFLAGTIVAAHAGGMGRGSGGAYVCYLASGDTPGGSMKDLTDDFFVRDVKIGGVRLICSPVTGATRIGPKAGNPPDPCVTTSPTEVCADHLVCYNILSSKGDNPAATVTMNDFFFDSTTDGVGGAQVLCVGAQRVTPAAAPVPLP